MSVAGISASPLGVFLESPLGVLGSVSSGNFEYEIYVSGNVGGVFRYNGGVSDPNAGIFELIDSSDTHTGNALIWDNFRLWAGSKYWNGLEWIQPSGVSFIPGSDSLEPYESLSGHVLLATRSTPSNNVYAFNYTTEEWEVFGSVHADVTFAGKIWNTGSQLFLMNAGEISEVSSTDYIYASVYNSDTDTWDPFLFTTAAGRNAWPDSITGGVYRFAKSGGAIFGIAGKGTVPGYFNNTFTYWDGVQSATPNLKLIDDSFDLATAATSNHYVYRTSPNADQAVAVSGGAYMPGYLWNSSTEEYLPHIFKLTADAIEIGLTFYGTGQAWNFVGRATYETPSTVVRIDSSRMLILGSFSGFNDGTARVAKNTAEYNFLTGETKQVGLAKYSGFIATVDGTPSTNTFRVTVNDDFVEVIGNTSASQTAADLIAALQGSVLDFISDYDWSSSGGGSISALESSVGYAYDPVLTVSGAGSGSVTDFTLDGIGSNGTVIAAVNTYPTGTARPTISEPSDQVWNAANPYSLQVASSNATHWELFDAPPTMTVSDSGLIVDTTPTVGTWDIIIYAANARTFANGASYQIVFQDDAPVASNPSDDSVNVDSLYFHSVSSDLSSGDPPYTYTIEVGPVLTAASMDSDSGFLFWRPTVAESVDWEIRVTNSVGNALVEWNTTTNPAP